MAALLYKEVKDSRVPLKAQYFYYFLSQYKNLYPVQNQLRGSRQANNIRLPVPKLQLMKNSFDYLAKNHLSITPLNIENVSGSKIAISNVFCLAKHENHHKKFRLALVF